jgi:hypothetical protein
MHRWQKASFGSFVLSDSLRSVQFVLFEMWRLRFLILGSTLALRIEVNWFSQSLMQSE